MNERGEREIDITEQSAEFLRSCLEVCLDSLKRVDEAVDWSVIPPLEGKDQRTLFIESVRRQVSEIEQELQRREPN